MALHEYRPKRCTGTAMGTFNTAIVAAIFVPCLFSWGLFASPWMDAAHIVSGVAVFWLVTCACTYVAWTDTVVPMVGATEPLHYAKAAGFWGAFNAVAFFFLLAVVWTVLAAIRSLLDLPVEPGVLQYTWILAIFGAFFSASFGALVGLLVMAADLLVWEVIGRRFSERGS